MTTKKLNLMTCAFAVGAIALSARPADASMFLYTFTGDGTGTIGTDTFTSQPFTITFTEDTGSIAPLGPGYYEYSGVSGNFIEGANNLTITGATIEVNGNGDTGSGSFDTVFLFNGDFGSSIGISDDPTLAGYALATSIDTGAITGGQVGAFQDVAGFSTSSGPVVEFTSLSSLEFSASPVPEPSSLTMFAIGLFAFGGIGVYRRRTRGLVAARG